MALVANPKVEELVRALKTHFAAIADKASADKGMLYDDMLAFGKAFAEMDPKGKHGETKLLADILAVLNDDQKHMPYEYILKVIDTEIADADTHPRRGIREMCSFVDGLKSLQLIARAFQSEDMHEPGYEAANAFIDLVDMYVMRDGNLTNNEITLIDHIENLFAGEEE